MIHNLHAPGRNLARGVAANAADDLAAHIFSRYAAISGNTMVASDSMM